MQRSSFKVQYRKFRMLIARFFSYGFFIVFATLGIAVALIERFVPFLRIPHLETMMILVLVYALLIYVVTERAKVLDDIHENIRGARAAVYPSREAVYSKIPLVIARAAANPLGRRRIFHAALHGRGGRRIARPPLEDPLFALFDQEIDRCVVSTGAGMWHVYEIYDISDEERLDAVIELLERRKDAEGYEVRAFSLPDGLPHLSPLIIGDEDLLIGVDDPRYYRAGAVTHLQGREHVRLAREYFYSLWNDPRARVLKSETGVRTGEIDALRARIAGRAVPDAQAG